MTQKWLKLFWTLVDVSERSTRDLLHEWPLLPTTRGALVSCSIFSSTLCLTRAYEDVKLRRRLERLDDDDDDDDDNDVPPGVLEEKDDVEEKKDDDGEKKDNDEKNGTRENNEKINEHLHLLLERLKAPLLELAYFPVTSSIVLDNEDITRLSSIVLKALYVLHRAKGSIPELRWKELSTHDRLTLLDLFAKDPAVMNATPLSPIHLDSLCALPLFTRLRDETVITIQAPEKYVTLNSELVSAIASKDSSATTAKALMSLGNVAKNFIIRPERSNHNRLLISMGVHEIDESTTLTKFIFKHFQNLEKHHRDDVMERVVKTSSLRQDPKIISALKTLPFVELNGKSFKASEFYDPRVSFFKKMLKSDKFPRGKYATPEWLDLLGSLGLITEVNGDMILRSARSIAKDGSSDSTNVMKAEYFVNYLWTNFAEFWSRDLCEKLSKLRFVPVRSAKSYSEDCVQQVEFRMYKDCSVPNDGDIVFHIRPILRDTHVPPHIAWDHLGLKTPPPTRDVLRHVDALTKCPVDRWNWQNSLVKTFQSIFAYLQKEWNDLSSSQQRHLRSLRLIPINGRLVRPTQLFFNLKAQVSPLLFEVPRVFGAYDTLFRNLGASSRPSMKRFLRVLHDLHADLGDSSPLNPNELRAVVNMLDMMIETREIEKSSRIYVPDAKSILVERDRVVYVDDFSLAKRVEHFSLCFASPSLNRTQCKFLGVKKLSDVVHEEIESMSEDNIAESLKTLEREMESTMRSKAFACTVASLIRYESHGSHNSTTTMMTTVRSETSIVDTLSKWKLRFVSKIRTRLLLRGTKEVARDNTSTSFLERKSQTIFVKTKSVHLTDLVVARLVNRVLGSPLRDVSSIAALMRTQTIDDDVLGLFGIDMGKVESLSRGVPGEILLKSDESMLRLTPLRNFRNGEVVAWEDDDVLRYGVVQKLDTDSNTGLSRVCVCIRSDSNSTKTFTSSEIYSFVDRGRGDKKMVGKDKKKRRSMLVSIDDDDVLTSTKDDEEEEESNSRKVVPIPGIMNAVDDILKRAGLSLESEKRELIRGHLDLKDKLAKTSDELAKKSNALDELQREREEEKKKKICPICLGNNVNCVLVPCGHQLCSECLGSLRQKTCPFDRRPIQLHVPLLDSS